MTKVTSFVAHDRVDDILAELPWGQRSKFINDCIICKAAEVDKELETNRNFQNQSNGSENSKTSTKPFSEPSTSSKEPAATAKPTTTKSEQNTKGPSILSLALKGE